MIRPTQPEGYKDGRRQSSTAFATPGGTTALPGMHRAELSCIPRNTASDAIAEDPTLLSLAGKLISWATVRNEVRFEKVAVLRQAIEAGTYQVSSADLAEKLLDGLSGQG